MDSPAQLEKVRDAIIERIFLKDEKHKLLLRLIEINQQLNRETDTFIAETCGCSRADVETVSQSMSSKNHTKPITEGDLAIS